ncbi:response regulator [Aquimarina rhabdastrellae]
MKKRLKVLMIDDHPMIIEGYKNTLLGENQRDYNISIDVASNCDDAYAKIVKASNTTPYHLLFIDIKLPPSSDGKITSGEDLAKTAKKLLPKAKIIILTMHREDHRIHNIFRNINPSGFLIKSDLTSVELLLAFNTIMSGTPYYSATVNNHFRKMMNNNFSLDEKNLKILYHLSRGVKTKNLPDYVSLSLSAIEKRKNHIKELFAISKGDDQQLLEEARKRGFV